jgi:serine protease Do
VKLKALTCTAALAMLFCAPALARAQGGGAATPPPASPAPPAAPAEAHGPLGFATALLVRGNFLGVRTEEITRENMSRYNLSGEPRGVGVREVVKASPAERAGLREGDVILRFDGEPVSSVRKLTRLIEESAPEHAARLTILRGGSEQELSATLSRRDPFVEAGAFPFSVYGMEDALRLGDEALKNSEVWKRNEEKMRRKVEEMGRKHPGLFAVGSTRRIGVSTSPLGKQLADYFGVSHGLLVNSVEAGSPAGDVVTEAGGQRVEEVSDLMRALGTREEGEVTLTLVRDRKQRTVRVTPERRPGVNLMPGSFRVIHPPVAALTPPHTMVLPRAAVAPRALVAPRAPRAPAAPRVRVFGPGERIL